MKERSHLKKSKNLTVEYMLAKRIIPCLDIKDGKTVKGVNFMGVKSVGDPVEMAEYYSSQMADELVFLDISATIQGAKTFAELVEKIALKINIPFTVGGGISSVEDAYRLLEAGADKISINSAAVRNPQLISDLKEKFGSQFIVVAIDAKKIDGRYMVTTHAGTRVTGIGLYDWAAEVERLGAGEILFTSMDCDGTKKGYDCQAYKRLTSFLSIPVIASGGAGSVQDIADVLSDDSGCADAALAASVFHYGTIKIPDLKAELRRNGIPVRI